MKQSLLDWLFPRRCLFCRRLTPPGEDCCPQCRENIPRPPEALCRVKMGDVERLYAGLYYAGRVPVAIGQLKFRQQPRLSGVLVDFLTERAGQALMEEGCDFVCDVPMHPSRQRQRGYNQAQLLAKDLAKALDLPYVPCLEKSRLSAVQHELSGEERRLAQRDSYRCIPLQGQKVLLVDDVCTTGATMEECAKTLRAAGAGSVIGAAVALTPPRRLNFGEPDSGDDKTL